MLKPALALILACALLLVVGLPLDASADAPPKIPHPQDGREKCSSCHTANGSGDGATSALELPADHLGRPEQICNGCHAPAGAQASAATATPVQPPSTATPPAKPASTPTPPSAAGVTGTPTATPSPPIQGPVATPAIVDNTASALPSAGEPGEDALRAASIASVGILLLFGAYAVHWLRVRP